MLGLDPISLSEHMAITPILCVNCDGDIDIGDTCYIDESAGLEESSALIYCSTCVEEYFDD